MLIPHSVHLRPLAHVYSLVEDGLDGDDDNEWKSANMRSSRLSPGRLEPWVTPDRFASWRDSLEGIDLLGYFPDLQTGADPRGIKRVTSRNSLWWTSCAASRDGRMLWVASGLPLILPRNLRSKNITGVKLLHMKLTLFKDTSSFTQKPLKVHFV